MAMRPLLLIDRLPRALHARLDNWGDCMRDHARPDMSPTYRICQDLAKRAGQTRNLENDVVDERDQVDAARVEKAWRAAQMHVDGTLLLLLRYHYVTRRNWQATCRHLHIRARSYDDELVRAVSSFGAFLAEFDQRWNNSAHNLTTV